MEPLRLAQAHPDLRSHGPEYNGIRVVQRKPPTKSIRHSIRILLRVVALLAAAAIIGMLSHASVVWTSTRYVIQQDSNGMRQRAWPANIDLWPTWVMLGAAVIATCVQIVSLLTLCGPARHFHESRLRTWAVFFSSLFGIAAWVAAAVYFKIQDTKGKTSWDLWSWSCGHESLNNGKMSFETMCVEMQATFYSSIVVAVFEVLSLAIFGSILRTAHKEYARITEKI